MRLEAKYLYDKVIAYMLKHYPDIFITPIHDALLVKKSEYRLVLDIMAKFMVEEGHNPDLKVKDLRGNVLYSPSEAPGSRITSPFIPFV